MKKILAAILTVALLFALSSCTIAFEAENYFGFSKESYAVVSEEDTHGGFLGDGYYYLVLDCSGNMDAALSIVESWKRLPLSQNLEFLMYGGDKDGTTYGYGLADEVQMPEIENGYYCFEDRHAEANDSSDDSALLSRASYNFTLAVYDSDTNRLHYFEFDT